VAKLAELRKRAKAAGAEDAQIEDAEDGDTPRESLIELIIASAPVPLTPIVSAHDLMEPEPEPVDDLPLPEGSPMGNSTAMSARVLSVEEVPTVLSPITGWQDKPLIGLVRTLLPLRTRHKFIVCISQGKRLCAPSSLSDSPCR
jgi:hypothetical protein